MSFVEPHGQYARGFPSVSNEFIQLDSIQLTDQGVGASIAVRNIFSVYPGLSLTAGAGAAVGVNGEYASAGTRAIGEWDAIRRGSSPYTNPWASSDRWSAIMRGSSRSRGQAVCRGRRVWRRPGNDRVRSLNSVSAADGRSNRYLWDFHTLDRLNSGQNVFKSRRSRILLILLSSMRHSAREGHPPVFGAPLFTSQRTALTGACSENSLFRVPVGP